MAGHYVKRCVWWPLKNFIIGKGKEEACIYGRRYTHVCESCGGKSHEDNLFEETGIRKVGRRCTLPCQGKRCS